jgi:hypothetical protein
MVQNKLLIIKLHLNELLYLNLRFVKVQVLLYFQFLLSNTEGKQVEKREMLEILRKNMTDGNWSSASFLSVENK